MPPRWPRKPDRQNDPEFRKLDDRMNFAVHTALFIATNSGVWFFHNFNHPEWSWASQFSLIWGGILIVHFLYISAIADYSNRS
ncbi:hypothetical protein [Cyanobacterium aponinum]|uniref:2TM domain-containing protein n=1 Tax=Cyanobacterium aponinum (strain PCC 10605) TaxID=755178 RepID=K9Z3U1_CYAAP|nr:hypothetical protein [Cyanobacterium aponinum]AFZ53799.1 hypothetical protein Cyan10605_1696 [Cyanobacterium aponinum PCC 10605]